MRKLNQQTLDLIKNEEGFRGTAYKDVTGRWTIGWGHTSLAGAPAVTPGLKINAAYAGDILIKDLQQVVAGIEKLIRVPLNDNQFGALVSFAYNVGLDIDDDTKAEGLGDSTLLRKLNAGDFEGAANEFEKWVYAGGKRYEGLVKRRRREKELFLSPAAKPVLPVVPKSGLPAYILTLIVIMILVILFFIFEVS